MVVRSLVNRPPPCTFARSAAARVCFRRRNQPLATRATPQDPVVPEDVDLNDPELQQQIDAILKDLDPELLLDDTRLLMDGVSTATSQEPQPPGQQQQQQQEALPGFSSPSSSSHANAWQDVSGDEETESGMPEGVVLTRAEYKRKAAVLVELMAAQQSQDGDAVLQQKLSAFRIEVDEAMLHMLTMRLEAAKTHQQDAQATAQLQELLDLLTLEYQRAQATPALRLLDEVLDLLGDDPYLPGAQQRAEQVVQRLRTAFTGGALDNVDIFAAAAALAEDKALAAEALAVEFVPQASFVSEGMQLLQQAKDEMEQLAAAVTEAQRELQQVRNTQPQVLEAPEAQAHMQQVAAADAVLQQRKAAVAQLAYVLDLAQDLGAAERKIAAAEARQAAAAGDLPTPEELAALLGIE